MSVNFEMSFLCLQFLPKTNKNTMHSRKNEFIHNFWEEFTAWQFAFEIIWPLAETFKPLVCADFHPHPHAHRTHFRSVRRTHPHPSFCACTRTRMRTEEECTPANSFQVWMGQYCAKDVPTCYMQLFKIMHIPYKICITLKKVDSTKSTRASSHNAICKLS